MADRAEAMAAEKRAQQNARKAEVQAEQEVEQERLAAVGEMAAGLSFTLMAFAGGYIITGAGYAALFLLAGGLTILGAATFWVFFRTYGSAQK